MAPCFSANEPGEVRLIGIQADSLTTESLILAQNERWRRGLGMQVERESGLRTVSRVANG